MTPLPSFDPLGLPAPIWFLLALKVFGFWVHMVFMGLWFAGFIVGLLLLSSNGNLRFVGQKILKRMPIIIAFGVNAGIVPLLFLQVLYPQFFYTSTILQGWYWFFVIILVILAYYGTYYYVYNVDRPERTRSAYFVGWLSALIFLFLGIVFASEMQFMVSPERWSDFFSSSIGGAVPGNSLAFSGTALQRYFMVFGLSLSTVAAFIAFDKHALTGLKEIDSGELKTLIFGLTFLGLVVFGSGALPYLRYLQPYLKGIGLWQFLAGIGPFLALLGGFLYLIQPSRTTAWFLVILQALSLLFNAITRQIVQVRELSKYVNLSSLPMNVQFSPILLFLITLVVGILVIVWLLRTFALSAHPSGE